jgi:hypothetical protein
MDHQRFLIVIIYLLSSICVARVFCLQVTKERLTELGFALQLDPEQWSQTQ